MGKKGSWSVPLLFVLFYFILPSFVFFVHPPFSFQGPCGSSVVSHCCILHGVSLFSTLTNQNREDTGRRFLPIVNPFCPRSAVSFTAPSLLRVDGTSPPCDVSRIQKNLWDTSMYPLGRMFF